MTLHRRLFGQVAHEDDNGDAWTVGAPHYSQPIPGNRSGHPDTWEEDDGGELGELVALSEDTGEEIEEPALRARWGQAVVDELRVWVWRAALREPAECREPAPDYEPW